MDTLLTIGVPTYNRSQKLDKQLNWLAQAIEGFESKCEIIISDNNSTDDTQNVIDKFQPALSKATLNLNKSSENIGATRNIAYCINTSTSKYVWVISDDDPIQKQTLGYVLQNLSDYPDLSLLVLNFSKRDVKTGQLLYERCFAIDEETVSADGKAVFERCLKARVGGGISLTTAVVYRTDLAQQAIQEWPSGLLNNLLVQIYWSGFCALHGSVKVTKNNYLECTSGNHHFQEVKKLDLKFKYEDKPKVFLKLRQLGYSHRIGPILVIKMIKVFKWRDISRILQEFPEMALNAIPCYFLLLL